MQYPSRNADEAAFAKRMERLSRSQRAELRRLLGNPPDPANVPASFWADVEAEAEREALTALYLIFINSADFHLDGADDDQRRGAKDSVDVAGNAFSEALAAGMAQRWASTSRQRFERTAERMRKAADHETGKSAMTRQDVEDALAEVFSPDDAAGAAAYGTTAAETAGGESAARETYGINALDQWQTNPHLTRTGPCERCAAENGKPRKDWSQRYPSGPPIHEYCACTLNYANFGQSG